MFGELVMETCSFTGTGAYQLGGAAGGPWKTWRSTFSDGSLVGYVATSTDGTVREVGYGTLTYGSPDTISRGGLLRSTTGSAISWAGGDAPIYIYSTPIADVLNGLVAGGAATSRPWWVKPGMIWPDITSGFDNAIWKQFNGTDDREVFRFSNATFYNTSITPFELVGAASKTVVAADVGKLFRFDTSASVRTCTLPVSGDIYVGFTIEVYSTGFYNGVALTPDAADGIEGLPDGAVLTTLPKCRVKVTWDGVEWVLSGMGDPKLGEPIPYVGATLKSGHIWGNGGTIGDAASGATRANADTFHSFVQWWTDLTDTDSPMLTSAGGASTRGASAAADWAALKRLTVPDFRDRVMVGRATMGGASDPALIGAFDTTVLGKGYDVSTHTHSEGTNSTTTPVTGGGGAAAGGAHVHTINGNAHVPPALVTNVVFRLY